MKIAHIVQKFSPLSETFIYNQIVTLEELHCENHVFTYEMDTSERRFARTTRLKRSFNFFNEMRLLFAKARNKRNRKQYYKAIRHRKSLYQNLKQLQPDIIYTHFGPTGIMAHTVAKKLNIPIACVFYGYDISRLLTDHFWVDKYKKQLPEYEAVIGISNHIRHRLLTLGAHETNTHIIHLGISSENCVQSNPTKRIKNNTVRCIHVGRLIEKKSPLQLIRSFQHALKLVQGSVKLELVIIGNGPLYVPCEKYIAENDELKDKVKLMGSVSNDKVMASLLEAHLYTQHSVTDSNGEQEGQGVSLVEASSIGLPIITTNHNGFSDVVLDNISGYLVPENDWIAMGEKIAFLATHQDKWEEMGKQGIRHIQENYNLKTEGEKTIILFKSIIDKLKFPPHSA